MKIIILFFVSVFLNVSCFCHEKTLCICAIFKNESRFLSEWIDYHLMVGVEEFYLYNNESQDDYMKVLSPYINRGIVRLTQWPSQEEGKDYISYTFSTQIGAYNDCLKKKRGRSKWIAFIDVDEFIVPVKEESITEVLKKEFYDVSGLCINWVIFGTSGVKEITKDELMIGKLTMRAPIESQRNLIFKCIVQPDHVESCASPHWFVYKPRHWHVNTDRERVGNGQSDRLCIDKLRLNHYWTKDEKFFKEVKMPRYKEWNDSWKGIIEYKDSLNYEVDLSMIKFAEKLRAHREKS